MRRERTARGEGEDGTDGRVIEGEDGGRAIGRDRDQGGKEREKLVGSEVDVRLSGRVVVVGGKTGKGERLGRGDGGWAGGSPKACTIMRGQPGKGRVFFNT